MQVLTGGGREAFMRDTLCWSVCVTQPARQCQCLVAQRQPGGGFASARGGETFISKQTSLSLVT